jgi:hypothetical protein
VQPSGDGKYFVGGIEGKYTRKDFEAVLGLSTADGTYIRAKYGSPDNTNWGAAVQAWTDGGDGGSTPSSLDLFSYSDVKAALFMQFLDKKIVVDAKYSVGAGTDWDTFYGALWAAPTDPITASFNGTRGAGFQIKPVEGLNFGFSLPEFSSFTDRHLGNYFAETVVGLKYAKGFEAAAGFTPADTKFNTAKAYAGIKIPLADDKLNIFANAAAFNFGKFSNLGRIDLAAKAEYGNDKLRIVGGTVRIRGLVHHNTGGSGKFLFGDGDAFDSNAEKATTLNINPYVKYDFVKDKLMGKLDANINLGVAANSKAKSNIEITPSVWYVFKGDMQDNIGDMTTGFGIGDNSDKITKNSLTAGFKVSF